MYIPPNSNYIQTKISEKDIYIAHLIQSLPKIVCRGDLITLWDLQLRSFNYYTLGHIICSFNWILKLSFIIMLL